MAGGLDTLLAAVLEHVIEDARNNNQKEFQRRQIEPSRYEFVAEDMFNSESIPPSGAYTMKFIIHEWNDQRTIEILEEIPTANRALTSKVITVFVIEMVILSNEKDDWQAHVMDLEKLYHCTTMWNSFGERKMN